MSRPFQRKMAASPPQFNGSTIRRSSCLVILYCALFFSGAARAQFSPPDGGATHSLSGQFVVTGPARYSPLSRVPELATNADFIRLEPALLAITAERVKVALRRELGIEPNAPWRGKIFFVLHPAQSLDEEVLIISQPLINGWNYRVELPDILPQPRFLRALTGVLLSEMANQTGKPGGHTAEIPDWLADGLSQQLLAAGPRGLILSTPGKIVNGLPQSRSVDPERNWDALAGARKILREQPALTFEELSWPTDTQLNGEDGGAYHASAQVFVSGLLALKNGPERLRAMLAALPGCYNWQTAFHSVFQAEFPRPLDVEKWWALQLVGFAARDPGSVWTPAASRAKLDEILTVPVEMRADSNSLPAHAEVSLQTVIRNFDKSRQASVLRTKLRDLQLAQLRMAPQLAALTDGYRRALAAYLGERVETASVYLSGRQAPRTARKAGVEDTVKKLDALDARRRAVESATKPDVLVLP